MNATIPQDSVAEVDQIDIPAVFAPMINTSTFTSSDLLNVTNNTTIKFDPEEQPMVSQRGPLSVIIPITVILSIAFILSVLGNITTCVVIFRNRYMHTATNYYLFSLALSDLLLVLLGLPFELYTRWFPDPPYVFGAAFCVLRALAAETSTNASVLTILAFSVERYLAICRPIISHTMSRLSRAVRHIWTIWLTSLMFASLPAAHFGIFPDLPGNPRAGSCTVVRVIVPNVFVLSTVLFFVVPMVLLGVLYSLIGLKLRRSCRSSAFGGSARASTGSGAANNRRAIVKMLVAVVVAFFVCWAPFHAQRLMATYMSPHPSPQVILFGRALDHISGVLYYVSTCINPILYQLMSVRFQHALSDTFGKVCLLKYFFENDDAALPRSSSITNRDARNRPRSMAVRPTGAVPANHAVVVHTTAF